MGPCSLKQLQVAVAKGNLPKLQLLLGATPTATHTLTDGQPSLLSLALKHSVVPTVAPLLLKHGAVPSVDEYPALIIAAVKAADAVLLAAILRSAGDTACLAVNGWVRGWTPLMHAAMSAPLNIIEMLLRAGADLNARMENGGTPLMIAVQQMRLDSTRLLAVEGAELEAHDVQGWTALYWAAQLGNVEMIDLLIALGANVFPTAEKGSALMVAAENQQLPAVERLLRARCPIESTDSQGWTALSVAAGGGYVKILQYLLDASASIDTRTSVSKRTPLMAAAQGGHVACIKVLLSSPQCGGGMLNASDHPQCATALMFAAKNGHLETVEALLTANADPLIADATESTAIVYASKRGSLPVVATLLRSTTSSPASLMSSLARALPVAARAGHVPVVEALSLHGAPVQPLMTRAAAVGDSELMLVLLKAGVACDIDLASEAMLSAACGGHRGIVQLLLNAKASVFKQDRLHGQNALHLSSVHGHPQACAGILYPAVDTFNLQLCCSL